MSDPTTSNELFDPQIGLMVAAAEHLIPLFETESIDGPLARRMAISALYAYNPETRADFVNAARIIAFSLAALALLGKTASPDMTMPEKMRAFSRANALNRSADQSERTMMQRRRHDNSNPQADQPDPYANSPDAKNDDAQMKSAIATLMQEYQTACALSASNTATPEAAPAPKETAAPQSSTATPASAIRTDVPMPRTGQPAPSYKAGLLAQTAMHRVIQHNATQHQV